MQDMKKIFCAALTSFLGSSALANELAIKIEIPKLNVAEYHRPYVAFWIERPDQTLAANLSVWYDTKKRNNEGGKWLKDLRQWWRRSGRDLNLPLDGLSGATRINGEHQLSFSGEHAALKNLPAGDYNLIVEAAREGGGREVLKLPFQWNGKESELISAQGNNELGKLSLQIKK